MKQIDQACREITDEANQWNEPDKQGGFMNSDKITTIVGAVGAAVTGAQPVINSIQGSTLHSNDWLQLAMAVVFAVLGFFTNKQKKP